jgi:ribosomal-protein-serine acetyltransferase
MSDTPIVRFEIEISPGLALAPLETRHADELFRLTDANREHLREWLPWLDRTRGPDDTRAFLECAEDQLARNDGQHSGIFLGGRIIGAIGQHRVDWANRSTSLGYWIAKEHQGRGIAAAACRALVDHCFETLNLNRVEIRCATGNARSRAIPERLGFRVEGVLRDAERLYDRFVDLVVYAMLAREWRAINPPPPTPAE